MTKYEFFIRAMLAGLGFAFGVLVALFIFLTVTAVINGVTKAAHEKTNKNF